MSSPDAPARLRARRGLADQSLLDNAAVARREGRLPVRWTDTQSSSLCQFGECGVILRQDLPGRIGKPPGHLAAFGVDDASAHDDGARLRMDRDFDGVSGFEVELLHD